MLNVTILVACGAANVFGVNRNHADAIVDDAMNISAARAIQTLKGNEKVKSKIIMSSKLTLNYR